MKIDREKSAILAGSERVAEVIVSIAATYDPGINFNAQRHEFIPENITLKEVSRASGLSLNTVADAIKQEVVHRSGEIGYKSGIVFTDTQGHDWYMAVGPSGNKRSKQAARIAGKKKYGAEDRIRKSVEGNNKRENTVINFRRWY